MSDAFSLFGITPQTTWVYDVSHFWCSYIYFGSSGMWNYVAFFCTKKAANVQNIKGGTLYDNLRRKHCLLFCCRQRQEEYLWKEVRDGEFCQLKRALRLWLVWDEVFQWARSSFASAASSIQQANSPYNSKTQTETPNECLHERTSVWQKLRALINWHSTF